MTRPASKKTPKPIRHALPEMGVIFPLIVEHSPVGFLLVDADGKILLLNPKAQDIFGYTREELLGQPMEKLLPERFHKIHVHHRTDYMAKPRARAMGEGRHLFARHKSGHEISVEIGLIPLQTSKGMHVLASVIDITDKKRLEGDLLHAIEVERKRVGQDLHDSLGQQLLAVSFLCNVLKKKLAAESRPESSEAAHIEDLLNETKLNLRRVTRGLYAADLESQGLGACLKDLVVHLEETSAIPCRFEGDETLTLADRSMSENLYRLAQEALNNAVKHSFAKSITLSLKKEGQQIALSIKDSGVGLPEFAVKASGLGLRTMQYRAKVIGGSLDVRRHETGGTIVTCVVLVP